MIDRIVDTGAGALEWPARSAVIINCFGRSGSNILWNILASSPDLLSLRREFHEMLRLDGTRRKALRLAAGAPGIRSVARPLIARSVARRTDEFFGLAANDPFFRQRTPGVEYSGDELKRVGHTFKVMGLDIAFNPVLLRNYAAPRFIFLMRNPYAIAEGNLRRDSPVERICRIMNSVVERMDEWTVQWPRSLFVRYEDIVSDPAEAIAGIYGFADVAPQPGGEVIMKNKSVLSASGTHERVHGHAEEHFWVTREEFRAHFRTDVNENQIRRLSLENRGIVSRICSPLIERFGYDIVA